jgi:mono/diheme cytochrome c family protein
MPFTQAISLRPAFLQTVLLTRCLFVPIVGVAMVVVSCGGGSTAENAAQGVTQSRPGSTAGANANRVDMDAIFPQGPGRDLVLNNCQNCHTFVPIVVLQMEEDAWTRSSLNHRDRVSNLSDAEFATVYTYLKANFNPSTPVPTLPKELLESWTTY